MHGVRRGSRPTSADEIAAIAERSRIQAESLRRALAARTEATPADALKQTAQAVEANPDEYSLWSWRRRTLLNFDDTEFTSRWANELLLTQRALRRHPKAYAAWAHRLWLLGCERAPEEERLQALKAEHTLSGYMLQRDGRNFHGWAHRLRVRALLGTALGDELKFVTERINADFANYSAWHARSALLQKSGALEKELDFVRQAFYTEPDVQSTWFYHRWLLAGMPDADGNRVHVDNGVWERELDACNELLAIENDARWVLHAKAHMLAHLGRCEEAAQVFERLVTIVSYTFLRDALTETNWR